MLMSETKFYKHRDHGNNKACLRDAACLVVPERVEMDAPVQVRRNIEVVRTK